MPKKRNFHYQSPATEDKAKEAAKKAADGKPNIRAVRRDKPGAKPKITKKPGRNGGGKYELKK